MKQKYRWLFGALALIASASILFGCKPNVPPSSEPAKITVTVQGDEKVTVQEPKTFQVDKGSVWKTVKEKVKVTYTVGYELSNWKLGNKEGTALTDAHVFTENTTVYAVSKTKGSITYTVKHLQQNESGTDYTEVETDRETKTGTTGTNTEAVAKVYAGFTAQTIMQKPIVADGSTVIEVKYDRNEITLTLNLDGGNIGGKTDDVTVKGKFGAKVEKPSAPTKTGYTFNGWNPNLPDAFPAENTTYTVLQKSDPVPFTTVQYDRLKDYLNSPTNPPAADGVYYIEVTRLTNTDLKSSSWGTPSPLGQILKDCGKKVALKLSGAITVIGEHAFSGCMELTSITMPYGITEISWAAFLNCTGLTNVTIPNSVTAIGKSAFFGCTKLTEVHLPASLNEIRENPFSGCIHHTKLTVDAENRKYKSENNMVYTLDMKTLVCAAGGLTNITIPNSVTAIGKGSFSGCTGLTAVAIGTDVTKIDKMAFYECLNLSNITIKSTVLTDIDSEAFKGIKDDAQFTVKTEAVKTLLHTQGYIAEDRITVNPSL